MLENDKYLKNYTLAFIKMNNEYSQHCAKQTENNKYIKKKIQTIVQLKLVNVSSLSLIMRSANFIFHLYFPKFSSFTNFFTRNEMKVIKFDRFLRNSVFNIIEC